MAMLPSANAAAGSVKLHSHFGEIHPGPFPIHVRFCLLMLVAFPLSAEM